MSADRIRLALAGNPNVGKSTVFNALTGLRQHTGNWPGKTVSRASGSFSLGKTEFSIVDLPGIYSFDVRSEEESITRDYILSGDYDCLLLVCDATCLERGLHLLKQATRLLTSESSGAVFSYESAGAALSDESADMPLSGAAQKAALTGAPNSAVPSGVAGQAPPSPQIILCVNLCDEAEKKGIRIDFALLEAELGIPVVPCSARKRNGLDRLKRALAQPACASEAPILSSPFTVPSLSSFSPSALAGRAVAYERKDYRLPELRMDRIVTGPVSGCLIMCLLLSGIFWLTIAGANYPSALLWDLLFGIEGRLAAAAQAVGLPQWFISAFIFGMYRVVAWIVSVMLPPMAIFFPLFTLLEDLGYLPRAAFNMDRAFCRCHACGKQCLTMAMGLGCNAAGVVGCRIIDSPRERLIAILTNSLVPCNGRFPLLLMMITLLFTGGIPLSGAASSGAASSSAAAVPAAAGRAAIPGAAASGPAIPGFLSGMLTALALTCFILLGIAATLAVSWLLSKTLLKGVPSSFTLELPPYRRPQIGRVIVRSVFDRTLFVLGRAAAVAAPAGLLIWLMANIKIGESSLLALGSGFLDPLGRLMGLDGVILMAFILGFPANEIVLPVALMAYLQSGSLVETGGAAGLAALLSAHGWTAKTALCTAVFALFHWPCSTACLTIKKETGSLKWTAVSVLLPTAIGFTLCVLIAGVFSLCGC